MCRPLINVCDRFDMVTDLTHYLYSNNMLRYIEGYVQKVNPAKAPQVVGGLLDAEAPDDFVNNLILSVRSLIPVEQLCEEVGWSSLQCTLLRLTRPLYQCTAFMALSCDTASDHCVDLREDSCALLFSMLHIHGVACCMHASQQCRIV